MNPHTEGITAGTCVPVKVAAALAGLDTQYRAAMDLPHHTAADSAIRAERLAFVCARRAGWWRVLERWAYHGSGHDLVIGRAVIAARTSEQASARFWRDLATDWHAHAHGDRHGSGLWAMWDDQPENTRGAVAS